jgi:molybdopterin-guanine dinucleotide biosynthesis protein A
LRRAHKLPKKAGMQLGSIVLAGGRSHRMGSPKESLPFRGTTLLGHTVATLMQCTYPVVVVARDPGQELPPLPLESELVFDGAPDQGPLVGLIAGLEALAGSCEAAFVTACDVPFLTARAVGGLADRLGDRDMVIPRAGGKLQPLSAIYRTGVLAAARALLAEGIRTPRTLAERVNARILEADEVALFDPTGGLLRNVNSPDEYEAARQQTG